MTDRRQNEKEYSQREELPDGGRRYWRDRRGRVSGFQRIIKVVDSDETTLLVAQEIYNDDGELVDNIKNTLKTRDT